MDIVKWFCKTWNFSFIYFKDFITLALIFINRKPVALLIQPYYPFATDFISIFPFQMKILTQKYFGNYCCLKVTLSECYSIFIYQQKNIHLTKLSYSHLFFFKILISKLKTHTEEKNAYQSLAILTFFFFFLMEKIF